MDWPNNFVYVPMWLLILLVALSSGALQYVLIAAVKFVMHVTRERELAKTAAPIVQTSKTIVLLEEARRERMG